MTAPLSKSHPLIRLRQKNYSLTFSHSLTPSSLIPLPPHMDNQHKLLRSLFRLHYLDKIGKTGWGESLRDMLLFCCQLWKHQTNRNHRSSRQEDEALTRYIHHLYSKEGKTALDMDFVPPFCTFDMLKNLLEYGFKSGVVFSLENPTDLRALLRHTDSDTNSRFVDGLEIYLVHSMANKFPKSLLHSAYLLMHERFPHRTADEWQDIHFNSDINHGRHCPRDYKECFSHFSRRFPDKYRKKDTKTTLLHDVILMNMYLMNPSFQQHVPTVLAKIFVHKSVGQWRRKCKNVSNSLPADLVKKLYSQNTWLSFYSSFLPRYELLKAGRKGNPIDLDESEEVGKTVQNTAKTTTNVLDIGLSGSGSSNNETMSQGSSFVNKRAVSKVINSGGSLIHEDVQILAAEKSPKSQPSVTSKNLISDTTLGRELEDSDLNVSRSLLRELKETRASRASMNASGTSDHSLSSSKNHSTAFNAAGSSRGVVKASTGRDPLNIIPPSNALRAPGKDSHNPRVARSVFGTSASSTGTFRAINTPQNTFNAINSSGSFSKSIPSFSRGTGASKDPSGDTSGGSSGKAFLPTKVTPPSSPLDILPAHSSTPVTVATVPTRQEAKENTRRIRESLIFKKPLFREARLHGFVQGKQLGASGAVQRPSGTQEPVKNSAQPKIERPMEKPSVEQPVKKPSVEQPVKKSSVEMPVQSSVRFSVQPSVQPSVRPSVKPSVPPPAQLPVPTPVQPVAKPMVKRPLPRSQFQPLDQLKASQVRQPSVQLPVYQERQERPASPPNPFLALSQTISQTSRPPQTFQPPSSRPPHRPNDSRPKFRFPTQTQQLRATQIPLEYRTSASTATTVPVAKKRMTEGGYEQYLLERFQNAAEDGE